MTNRIQKLKRAEPFVAGVLIGSSAVTPAFAATLDVEALQPVVLLGSLILLVIGLVLKAVAMSHASKPRNAQEFDEQNRRDLRWQELGASIDVPLPASALR